jgi:hypothetical protein
MRQRVSWFMIDLTNESGSRMVVGEEALATPSTSVMTEVLIPHSLKEIHDSV